MKRIWVVFTVVCVALLSCAGYSPASASTDHEGQIQAPASAKSLSGKKHQDVALQFEKAGFSNVSEEALGDLILGFLYDDGEVDEVSIDGDTEFDADAWYAADANVVIRYHSYPETSSKESSQTSSSDDKSQQAPENDSESGSSSKKDGEGSASAESSASIEDCKGKKATKAASIAESLEFLAEFDDSEGRDVTDIVTRGSKDAKVRKAKVKSIETSRGFFGSKRVTFTLDYSTSKAVKKAEGETAEQAAKLAENNAYRYEFYDNAGDEITEEVVGKKAIEAARNAIVNKVTLDDSSLFGDYAKFSLDYGVPKEYKTALRKAQSYADSMHMSKAGIYDQMTSEYGEQYSAEAAQYAVDNIVADWNENALIKARGYQDMFDMSPAAIYDQLVSEYGEQFTPEEAQYAIDNL